MEVHMIGFDKLNHGAELESLQLIGRASDRSPDKMVITTKGEDYLHDLLRCLPHTPEIYSALLEALGAWTTEDGEVRCTEKGRRFLGHQLHAAQGQSRNEAAASQNLNKPYQLSYGADCLIPPSNDTAQSRDIHTDSQLDDSAPRWNGADCIAPVTTRRVVLPYHTYE